MALSYSNSETQECDEKAKGFLEECVGIYMEKLGPYDKKTVKAQVGCVFCWIWLGLLLIEASEQIKQKYLTSVVKGFPGVEWNKVGHTLWRSRSNWLKLSITIARK